MQHCRHQQSQFVALCLALPGKPLAQLLRYGVEDAERCLEFFSPVPFDRPLKLPCGITLILRHAGHILGAATAEIAWNGRRVAFSGDLGRYDDPVLPDPTAIAAADHIVVESTYGNRLREPADATEALGAVVECTTARGGTVIVPAFAVGRTQLLLYHLWKLKRTGRLANVPNFLDSPMAIDAAGLLHAHRADHNLTREQCDAICGITTYIRDVVASKAITASPYPKVIISASGMATGGRVLHHLKAYAPDRRNTILFSGFQAADTRGRAMLEGAREIRIHGQWFPVNAAIADLSMLSAHAGADELMRWLQGFRRPPLRAFVVHGEEGASEALCLRIGRELGWDAVVLHQGESYGL
jgi:metallo-beta-lactamase family protein